MKSKTLIGKQLKRKRNPELVETLMIAKKNEKWLRIASLLSRPTRKRASLNLNEIVEKAGEEKKVLVPGKVLSQGEINKKIKIIALNFSGKAKEKLLNAGCEVSDILSEIKSNPLAEGIKILNVESKDSKLSKTRKVFSK